jgi:hypothetical protein
MTNYPGTLLTHGQDVHYPGVWQHQDDLPWSPVDASHSHTTVLTQRLRTSPWPEDLVEGHAGGLPVQHLNPSSVYPSQISSPLSNASWHPSEMVLLTSTMQLPDPFLNHAQESFQGEDLMFREHQDLSGTLVQNGPERENCQFLPLIYNMQNPSPSDSWNSVDVSRSIHFMPEEFTLTDWPTLLNEQLSNNVSETTSNFPPTSPVPQGVDGLFRPMSKGVVPTTLKDRKWEHTIVSDGSIQQLGNQTTFKCSKKKGRRIGALSEDTARKAREVRHNRACWRCWHLHLSVSK